MVTYWGINDFTEKSLCLVHLIKCIVSLKYYFKL